MCEGNGGCLTECDCDDSFNYKEQQYKDCKCNPKERDKLIREDMNKGGNFNGILNVLSALRQEDPYMFELCLKYPEVYTNKEM